MELTPKEKAEELFEKYNDYLQQEMQCIVYVNQSKQCALIAVDEIISIKLLWFQKDTEHLDFWKEVKEELLKM